MWIKTRKSSKDRLQAGLWCSHALGRAVNAHLAFMASCSFSAASARLAWSAPGRERARSSAERVSETACVARALAAACVLVIDAFSSASLTASEAACLRSEHGTTVSASTPFPCVEITETVHRLEETSLLCLATGTCTCVGG